MFKDIFDFDEEELLDMIDVDHLMRNDYEGDKEDEKIDELDK